MCLQKQNHEQLLTYTFIIDASHIFLVKAHTFSSIKVKKWKKEQRLFCDKVHKLLIGFTVITMYGFTKG